ncbi:MAG: hypothetical protein KBD73_03700 [Candidatus Magasanikbacteria bacterium]|nr:hypothetical protein [Candidatus Magasanikbacteria bacterium]
MFGFKKKKKVETAPATVLPLSAHISVIPFDFYGGKDPVVHFETNKPTKEHVVKSSVDTVKKTVQALPGKSKIALTNKKFFVIGGLVLFLLCVVGTSIYVFRGYFLSLLLPTNEGFINPKNPATPSAPVVNIPSAPEKNVTSTESVVINTSSTITDSIVTPQQFPDQLGKFPEQNLANTADLDADQLTDAEEEFFLIDPGSSDTDQDGYYDGLEVFNLYNPKGFAPVKIIDSGLVKEYISSNWQYRLYYPTNWQSAEVDKDGNQVIFSTANGDFIEVRAFSKPLNQSFPDWFGATVLGEKFSDLVSVKNRFGVQGYERVDRLVSYFPTDTKIFVLLYHATTPGPISYRHIMIMATQSFRVDKNTIEIPEQAVLPKENMGLANQP